ATVRPFSRTAAASLALVPVLTVYLAIVFEFVVPVNSEHERLYSSCRENVLRGTSQVLRTSDHLQFVMG
ncbi:MAG TPA: hypothetical protein PLX64_15820, partial [Flavobacteriales bacterium]|nr:hypothetical protein [Flavobacteriales bacterium]